MRGSFEYDEPSGHVLFGGFGASMQNALAKGFRIGFIGGTDNHCGRAGSTMRVAFHGERLIGSATTCDLDRMQINRTLSGLAAVYAKELTREAVYDALRQRRCYATTGARILLHVDLNGLRMGEEGPAASAARLHVKVAGTAPIASVTVVRSNADAHTETPDALDHAFVWEDPEPERGAWYYVSVVQSDGHMAWSSPIWTD